jgi:hypothetical protein
VGGGGGTPPPDPPPTITAGPTLLLHTSVSLQFTWSSNQFVQGWLEYGLTTGYGSETAHENSFSYSTHVQTIAGLAPGTLYHVRAHIVNQLGAHVVGADVTATTDGVVIVVPPDPPPPGTGGGGISSYPKTAYAVPAGITTISALQSWLDANVPNGTAANWSWVQLGAGRTYTGSAGVLVSNKHFIIYDGGGTEVAWGHTGGAVIATSGGSWGSTASSCFRHEGGGSDLVFHGLTALGSSPSSGTGAYASSTAGDGGEIAMGFLFRGLQRATIDHCIMDRNKGDGVYLAMSGSTWTSLTIRDCTIKRNGRMGFGIIASNGIICERVFFDDICYSPIDYEPNGGGEGASGVHLYDSCRFGNYSWDNTWGRGAIIFITGSSSASIPSGSLTFANNVIAGRNMAEPSLTGSLFYLHRGPAKGWSLNIHHNDGAAAEGPATNSSEQGAVVYISSFSGPSTIRHNRNMVTTFSHAWVLDAGGNTGSRDWQSADES